VFIVKINERGQITIPKRLRARARMNPNDNLEINLDSQGRLIITKKDIFSDLEDLIRKDLVSEGRSAYEVETMLPGRKRELGEALLRMSADAESEIAKGEYSSLEQLKKELDSDGEKQCMK
jgi:AbrB family looped-hinge helix DNA binding protein